MIDYATGISKRQTGDFNAIGTKQVLKQEHKAFYCQVYDEENIN